MRIERINNNQIKCFLNKNDLVSRHIKVSELAYGTEKAQELFRDMMDQASDEVGFDVENVPIMIEAVPLSTDSIMVIITKVDNPEDIENKFSSLPNPDSRRFTKKGMEEESAQPIPSKEETQGDYMPSSIHAFFVYRFNQLDTVIKASKSLASYPFDTSTLYKNPSDNLFYLVLTSTKMKRNDAKLVRGLMSEYGEEVIGKKTITNHFDEHYETIIKDKALTVLPNF